MLIYEASKKQFIFDNISGPIEDLISKRFLDVTGRKVAPSEMKSWEQSLKHMTYVLNDFDIPDSMGVAVELMLTASSKRIDVTLTGYDASHKKNAIIIELKQWEKIKTTNKDAIVETYVGGAEREMVHPSYQAWSYSSYFEDFNESVSNGNIRVSSCAYLHNYDRDGLIDSSVYDEYTKKAPLFLKGRAELNLLQAFIKQHVKYGDNKSILYELDDGRIRPSKDLANSLVGLMQNKSEFVLIDDQKLVFEKCLHEATKSTLDSPCVIIIEGGPGTGKTVLAINILVNLISDFSLNCRYVSKNSAPREVYQSKLTGVITKTRFSNLFTGSGAYIDESKGVFDTLIVDEAHRLNEKSGLYGNLGNNQIKELINASNCTIFFIDEDQRISLSDIGRKDSIRKFAEEKHARVIELELSSQFRCRGSDGYLAWLDNTLGIRSTANFNLSSTDYEFKVFDTPQAMQDAIEAKNTENRARVVAGYCWPWKSKKDPSAIDIVIGDSYQRRWNLTSDGSLWIVSPDSVHEVGCIHTCQGLEVDYIGVIVGPDLIVRDGVVCTEPLARDRHDKTLKGFKTKLKNNPIEAKQLGECIVKNTYRTLMTRGLKGCYIYCTDEETRNYFSSRLK